MGPAARPPVVVLEPGARIGQVADDDAARRPVAPHRIHHDRECHPVPEVEQLSRVRLLDKRELSRPGVPGAGAGPQHPAEVSHDGRSHGVVAPIGAAHADDDEPRAPTGALRRAGHPRSTVRVRKCVAHEMHGS